MGTAHSTEPASWDGQVLALQQVTTLLTETQLKIDEAKRMYVETPIDATATRVLHDRALMKLIQTLVSLQCEQEELRAAVCVRK